ASAHVARQAQVADADLAFVPGGRLGAGHQVESRSGLQLHLAFGEALDAQLGTGQVGEDADLHSHPSGGFAYRLRAGALGGRIAVREVEADDVDASAQQRI